MSDIFKFELKRNLNKNGISIFLMFVFFAVIILQFSGIEKLKKESVTKEEFILSESKKIERYFSYIQYGWYGYTSLFFPSTLSSIFQNSTTIDYLKVQIDPGDKLDLNSPKIGEYMFKRPTGGNIDFSWYMLVIMSILNLTWGWFTFRNHHYIKLLASCASLKSVYFGIFLGRIFLLICSLSFLVFIVAVQLVLNNLTISGSDIKGLLIFLLILIALATILLIISSLSGLIKNKRKSIVLLFSLCLILVLLWSEFLNLAFSNKSENDMKTIYSHEISKLRIMMDFEQFALNYSKDKGFSKKSDKEMSERFFNNDSKKIEEIEYQMLSKIEEYARDFHLWSIINPITFYKSVNNELSSKGYKSYISFFRYNILKKREFLKYYINRKFDSNYKKVEPFLSGDECVFHAKPSLPYYFGLGVLVQIFYIVVLFVFGFFCFNRVMFPREKKSVFSGLALKLEKGKHCHYHYFSNYADFPDQVFNVFMGKPGRFTGKISIDDKNIVTGEKKNFVYLPNPDAIPGTVKVKAVINLLAGLFKVPKSDKKKLTREFEAIIKKPFEKIKEIDKVNLMFRFAKFKRADIYLLHNFFIHIYQDKKVVIGIIDELRKEGVYIMELCSVYLAPHGNHDRVNLIRKSDSGKYEATQISDL